MHILPLPYSVPPAAFIVAVTKAFPYDAVLSAHSAGYRHLGENRVEEAEGKIIKAKKDGLSALVWHMIGHVQSRKIADVVRLFDRIDSVDSFELLERVNECAGKSGRHMRVLLQVNLSGESSKSGFDMVGWMSRNQAYKKFITVISMSKTLPYVILDGLMTMAPYVRNPEENRVLFRSMRALSETIRMQNPHVGASISMGTSCDWTVAIEEGATEVRLGEALFGARTVMNIKTL